MMSAMSAFTRQLVTQLTAQNPAHASEWTRDQLHCFVELALALSRVPLALVCAHRTTIPVLRQVIVDFVCAVRVPGLPAPARLACMNALRAAMATDCAPLSFPRDQPLALELLPALIDAALVFHRKRDGDQALPCTSGLAAGSDAMNAEADVDCTCTLLSEAAFDCMRLLFVRRAFDGDAVAAFVRKHILPAVHARVAAAAAALESHDALRSDPCVGLPVLRVWTLLARLVRPLLHAADCLNLLVRTIQARVGSERAILALIMAGYFKPSFMVTTHSKRCIESNNSNIFYYLSSKM